jgi:hypothetical protein
MQLSGAHGMTRQDELGQWLAREREEAQAMEGGAG